MSPRDLAILQQPDDFLLTGEMVDGIILETMSDYFKGKYPTLSLKELIDLSLNTLMDYAEANIEESKSLDCFRESVDERGCRFSEAGEYIWDEGD